MTPTHSIQYFRNNGSVFRIVTHEIMRINKKIGRGSNLPTYQEFYDFLRNHGNAITTCPNEPDMRSCRAALDVFRERMESGSDLEKRI